MARTSTNTDELRRLIRDLSGLPADVRRELRPALRKAGQHALVQARANASWSRQIPPAIRLSVSFAARRPGVTLIGDRRKAPPIRAFENLGRQGFFRHPVPNTRRRGLRAAASGERRRWVSQRARPFLFPAAEQAMQQIDADIGAAVEAAARKHGFK
ncbi:HK97 gp10 family phage protein [Nonomuraea sp. NPDC023979]|uniref:HK97 gp10 family phage protein n=1 Tax=Nonomuraea sp. NPDC023979 TaxID=3154796 RepID=UPI0033E8DC8C